MCEDLLAKTVILRYTELSFGVYLYSFRMNSTRNDTKTSPPHYDVQLVLSYHLHLSHLEGELCGRKRVGALAIPSGPRYHSCISTCWCKPTIVLVLSWGSAALHASNLYPLFSMLLTMFCRLNKCYAAYRPVYVPSATKSYP